MIYDLSNELQRKGFLARTGFLLQRGAVVELSEKAFRTRNQNSYLHLLLGVIAMDTGNTLAYCKEWYFKRLVNPDIFIVAKEDKFAGNVETLRSSAELSKEEMSTAIDRLKRWGADNGIYLPNAGDEALLKDIEIEMGRQRAYI